MPKDATITEAEVRLRLEDISIHDNGRVDAREREDGIHELVWWDISPEDADELVDLNQYDNVGLRTKNSTRGSNMETRARLAVFSCIIPAPPENAAEDEWEQYEKECEAYFSEQDGDDESAT